MQSVLQPCPDRRKQTAWRAVESDK